METNNWRNEESRQKIVNKIMDTLRRHMPHRGPDGMNDLKKTALRFENKIYTQAGSQKDYLQRISLKMLSLESKAIQPSFPGSSPGNSQRSLDSGWMMRAQIRNQPQASGNGLPLPGQPQTQQLLLQQTLQNSISASGKPSSAGLAPPLSSIPMPGISHSSINSSTGQVLPSLLASSQRQLQSRQQQHQHQVVQQHQQLPSQQHQLFYQHQLQHQQAFKKQKLQQQSQICWAVEKELDKVNSGTKDEAEMNATVVPPTLDQILPKTRKSERIAKKRQGGARL